MTEREIIERGIEDNIWPADERGYCPSEAELKADPVVGPYRLSDWRRFRDLANDPHREMIFERAVGRYPGLAEMLNGNHTKAAGGLRAGSPASTYSPTLYTSAEFFKADFRRDWHVRNVLVKGQPAVVGGGKKLLKSSIAIDLAISIDTATPFLGYESFKVAQRGNVLLLNGESGESTMQETARRVARARGIDPDGLQIMWGTDLPQLASIDHLNDLAVIVEQRKIDVVIIDPSYLCLLAGIGPDGPKASNLFQMGEHYARFAQVCKSAKCTPILAAHAKKDRTNEPPDLDDLAFAGIAEWARQWILLSRRERYEGDGVHKLWLNIGGSAGHSFLGHLDVDEGTMAEDFSGRQWAPVITPYGESLRERKAERDKAKATEKNQDELDVMATLDKIVAGEEPATLKRLRDGSGLSRDRTDCALERLRLANLIEEHTVKVTGGNNAKQDAKAFRRRPE